MAKSTVAREVVKSGKPMKSDMARVKKSKTEERVWSGTTQGRFQRMGRKEKFVQSVKSVVDVLAQAGLVSIPENLLFDLHNKKLITTREFKRLISVTKPLTRSTSLLNASNDSVKKPTTKKVRKTNPRPIVDITEHVVDAAAHFKKSRKVSTKKKKVAGLNFSRPPGGKNGILRSNS